MGEACNHQCDSCGSNGNCSTQDLEHEKRVKEHTSGVKNVIAVVGGKGGVGKSLVTSLLAIQTQRLGYHAAILSLAHPFRKSSASTSRQKQSIILCCRTSPKAALRLCL